jgi:hypothetical protein
MTTQKTELVVPRRNASLIVKGKKSASRDKAWRAAQAALEAAQKMPRGPARISALKQAGWLRFKADERRREKERGVERGTE